MKSQNQQIREILNDTTYNLPSDQVLSGKLYDNLFVTNSPNIMCTELLKRILKLEEATKELQKEIIELSNRLFSLEEDFK